jgi:hypothetical protein
VRYPDGRIETRIDDDVIVYAQAAVQIGTIAYNADVASRGEDESIEAQNRQAQLLDAARQAISAYNVMASALGKPLIDYEMVAGLIVLK